MGVDFNSASFASYEAAETTIFSVDWGFRVISDPSSQRVPASTHPTQRQVSRSVIRDGDTTTGADGPYRPTICLGSNPSSKHQVRSSIGRSTVHQLSLSNPVPCSAALVFKERAVTSSRTAHRLVHLVRLFVCFSSLQSTAPAVTIDPDDFDPDDFFADAPLLCVSSHLYCISARTTTGPSSLSVCSPRSHDSRPSSVFDSSVSSFYSSS